MRGMNDFSAIKWVTIDATGTLIDPFPSVGEVYRRVLAAHGVEAPQPLLQQRFVQVFRQMTKVPRGVVTEESERAFWRDLVANVAEPWARGLDTDAFFRDAYDAFAKAENWRAPDGAGSFSRGLCGVVTILRSFPTLMGAAGRFWARWAWRGIFPTFFFPARSVTRSRTCASSARRRKSSAPDRARSCTWATAPGTTARGRARRDGGPL